MAMYDVTIRVRVEADSEEAASNEVMQQANAMLSVDSIFLVWSTRKKLTKAKTRQPRNMMENALPTDQAAVEVMLSDKSPTEKQRAIDDLLHLSSVHNGLQCDDCGSSRIDDNGLRGADLTFRCADCGLQWSPNI